MECFHRGRVALLPFCGLFGGFVHVLVAFLCSGHIRFDGDNSIFRCTVEGTAPSVAKVGHPKMQLYGDSHGITKNCTSTIFFECLDSLLSKVT
ncbi:hypothetical protein A2U01_0054267, partial [Trifolium medium]|nr:hypothetical protein [Trifolium medium]